MPKVIDCKPGSIKGGSEWTGLGRFKKSFEMTYTVLGDNTTQTEDDILNAIGLPALGTIIRGCFFVGADAKEVDTHALLWEVNCKFSSEAPFDSQSNQPEEPEDMTPEWSWDHEEIDTLCVVDQITGDPIETKAGEPLDITTQLFIPVLTIVRYQRSFDPMTMLIYGNKTNSAPFWGAPAKTVRMAGIKDRRQVIKTENFRQVTYILKFNLLMFKNPTTEAMEQVGWMSRPLHQGSYYKKSTGEKIPFLDKGGKPRIGNLTATGDDNGTAEPTYLAFNKHPTVNLNNLNLGPWT